MQQQWVTVSEASRLLDVTERTIQRYIIEMNFRLEAFCSVWYFLTKQYFRYEESNVQKKDMNGSDKNDPTAMAD